MKADIITIGDEILIGQVLDTNSVYLASELTKLGFTVRKILSIADNAIAIINTLDESIKESDLIIVTGGLGPTNDDKTKDTLTGYFKGIYIVHEKSLEQIRKFFAARGMILSERNRKQAEIPDTCEPLLNIYGTAPGMLFRKENKMIISLPGVPFEMKGLFEDQAKPIILSHFKLPVLRYRTILTTGLSESTTADLLHDWERGLEEEFNLAYLPSPGLLRLRLSISGDNEDYLVEKLNIKVSELAAILGEDNVFGFDDDTLSSIVGALLQKNTLTLSVSESCTGGYISHLITSVPGASVYFKGSIVAYSNEIKQNILDVEPQTIREYGAVNEKVVSQMAENSRIKLHTDFGLATSGIAGPDGGSARKPVGTTWISVATPERVITQKFLFGDNRERNIIRASLSGLNMLRIALRDYIKNSK